MTNSFSLTIPGEPVAKGRGRIVRIKKKGGGEFSSIKTPEKTRSYEDRVRQIAVREWKGDPLALSAVRMEIVIVRGIPKSWSKTKKAQAATGQIVPTGKPDVDNFAKSILDGLNGVVLLDDALVTDLRIFKIYGDKPHASIMLQWGM